MLTQQTHDTETEVCIFDFGTWFVIEFFRGVGSETRLIPKDAHSNLREKLFTSAIPSPKCLRCLGGFTHGHRYCWQISCEKSLRERGILPNEGTTEFKRLGNSGSEIADPYDPQTGLRYPPSKNRKRVLPDVKGKAPSLMEKEPCQNCCGHWQER